MGIPGGDSCSLERAGTRTPEQDAGRMPVRTCRTGRSQIRRTNNTATGRVAVRTFRLRHRNRFLPYWNIGRRQVMRLDYRRRSTAPRRVILTTHLFCTDVIELHIESFLLVPCVSSRASASFSAPNAFNMRRWNGYNLRACQLRASGTERTSSHRRERHEPPVRCAESTFGTPFVGMPTRRGTPALGVAHQERVTSSPH